MTAVIKRSLQANIDIINDSVRSYADAGRALRAIFESEQYKETHKTFRSFCKDHWNMSDREARRLIDAGVVADDLSGPIGPLNLKIDGKNTIFIPENAAQARAVAEVADDAKTRVVVWKAAVEAAPKDGTGKPKITAAFVKKVAQGIKGTKATKPKGKHSTNGDLSAPREAGEDATEPEHDETIKDQLDVLVPKKLRPVFCEVSTFRGIISRLGSIRNDIEELQRSDAGAAIPINDVLKSLGHVQEAMKFAVPHTECPKCRRKANDDCKACQGLLWITEGTLKRCRTKEDEQWLKTR